jgi:4-hydroxy-4-methyl-2-oxoglutarate aldolase
MAKKCGVTGRVVDCDVLDIEDIKALDYPVWSHGVTPITGKFRFEAFEVNGPVVYGGITVHPGDLAVADETGVVIIFQAYIAEVLERTIEAAEREKRLTEVSERGASMEEIKNILAPEKWRRLDIIRP